MNKQYQKLYFLQVLDYNKDLDVATWKNLSYSHSIEKLQRSVFLRNCCWNIGSHDITNSKETIAYTENDVYPQYFIKEVNYII